FKERINNEIKDQEKLMFDLEQRYIRLYNDYYLAKYLDWKTADSKADIGTYWNDIDFKDPSVMRNVAVPDRVQDFMRTFSDGTDGSFYNCVDVLREKADQGNDDILQFVLFTMADGFYQSNKENVTMYIIDNHILADEEGDGGCGSEPGEMLSMFIQNVNDLSIGGTPPNFSLTSHKGKMVNLNNYAKQGEYTLLIFWASWCHKCEQEMPVLNQVYDRFNEQGFQVVAFSLDMNETSWNKGITEKAVPGENVTQFKGWQSSIVKDYRITQTPTSFLLDGDGNVVLKPKRIYEVDNFLRKNLK
ncbi:MAG: TlpA family protein disulfide reductase, partial [Flavobacteriales bacterium]